MAKNQTRRVLSAQLAADREAFDALQGIENYTPANPAYTTARKPVKIPVMKIPSQMLAPGKRMIVVMYTQGKMIPMFRMLYANAEYGDMTRTSPEARRVNT